MFSFFFNFLFAFFVSDARVISKCPGCPSSYAVDGIQQQTLKDICSYIVIIFLCIQSLYEDKVR